MSTGWDARPYGLRTIVVDNISESQYSATLYRNYFRENNLNVSDFSEEELIEIWNNCREQSFQRTQQFLEENVNS